ncbi:Nn.00g055520.m01.CDS01 [Neocucurbitaria sp. VM-36]
MKSWNGLEDVEAPAQRPRTQVRWRALTATFVTMAVLAGIDTIFPGLKNLSPQDFYNSPGSYPSYKHVAKPFEWSQITPQEHLEFHKCFDEFECAKLSVPLDYFNGTYPDERVSIALVKLPAKVPVDDPRYGGPILLNPGGPGGSGATFALLIAKSLQVIVDSGIDPNTVSSDPKYFDLIGFDPRGIGETEPAAQCMTDDASQWSWNMREYNEGLLGSSDAALGRLWSINQAYGQSCKLVSDAQDGPDIKAYVATAFVARDMLEITERHAEYVSKQKEQFASIKGRRRSRCHDTYTPGKAKLQYWGFSYGTYLGSTFASMFPDRVGRLILDGVVSSYDYNHSLGNGSLTDTEKAMRSFYTFCHHSGPGVCPLATANGTVSDVEERFQSIVQSLYHNPLVLSSSQGPEILTFSDVKLLIFGAVYQPMTAFGLIAELLAAVEAGKGEILNELSFAYRRGHVYQCPVNGSEYHGPKLMSPVAEFAILCGDGLDQSHVDIDEFAEYWDLLERISPTAGSIWSMLRMRCASWKIRASYSFEGPFGANTSHPILFVSNTADPVTPLRSGRIMHSLFPGSGILIGDSAGHCSVSTPNPCTLNHVRAYFQTGVLPPPETVCIPPHSSFSLNSTDPKSPFYDPSLGNANIMTFQYDERDSAQQDLHKAGLDVQKAIAESDAFGFQKMFGGERVRNMMKIAA